MHQMYIHMHTCICTYMSTIQNLQGLMISGNPSFWHSAVNLRKSSGFSSLTRASGPLRGFNEINTPTKKKVHISSGKQIIIRPHTKLALLMSELSAWWISYPGQFYKFQCLLAPQRHNSFPSDQYHLANLTLVQ